MVVCLCRPTTDARLSGRNTDPTWFCPAVLTGKLEQINGAPICGSLWYLPRIGWSLFSPLLLPTLAPLGFQLLDIFTRWSLKLNACDIFPLIGIRNFNML